MARRPSAAVAALALGTLAACSDLTSPDGLLVQDGPSVSFARNATDLPVLGSATVNAAEPAGVNPSNFDITLRFAPGMTDAQKAYFEVAAARWEALINKDMPSITGTLPGNASGTIPPFTGTVDDILIDARIGTIDGPGRVLGSAGPRFVRNSDLLPISGSMNFDVVDIDFLIELGLFDEVIVHEMGHVLGIGTLWNVGRALRVGAVAEDPRFVGKHANLQYAEIGGVGLLQVENTGGPGTAGGHWRESTYRNELMTGFLNLGVNPLSRFSAGSLRDLGYTVAMSAEDYVIPTPTPVTANVLAMPGVTGVDLGEGEELVGPEAVIQ